MTIPAVSGNSPEEGKFDAGTPALRLFALVEVLAGKDQLFTPQELVELTGVPKPTMHRMLQQLEGAGIVQRDGDGRQFSTGIRLRRLAEDVLRNSTMHAARHGVLRQLVDEVGESCNITALSGGEVLYLDRVETNAPLRFYLQPGSRVPVHCSSSGKLFLARMSPLQRQRLLAHVPLRAHTSSTITDMATLDAEIEQVRRQGYALDVEEFLPGLLCLGVLAESPGEKANIGVALQAPIMRLSVERALAFLPALQRAAKALALIEVQNAAEG